MARHRVVNPLRRKKAGCVVKKTTQPEVATEPRDIPVNGVVKQDTPAQPPWWMATISAFEDDALFEEYMAIVKERRYASEPIEDLED